MPKELQIHPNERLDIPDFNRASSDYTSERASFEVENQVLDRRSRVLEGFRVRIEDQTANAGQITVINGFALDRDGQSIHDEEQQNSSSTLTLAGANTTFYLEIELIEVESDTDARVFWDPSFTNTSPNPDGKEAGLTVSTRKTPTWKVVAPVSTTAFDATANASSLRVPLAILSTNGSNVINATSTPGLVEVDPASVTETSVSSGGTTLRVFNSRLLGGVGDTVVLGFGLGTSETVTLTSNDLDNGVLVFGATANAHAIGEIVQATGTGRLVRQQPDPNDTAAHPDSTPRMWQGDEVRGGALVQSKDALADRDDLNVRVLKDKLDLLDALVREMKFGAFDPATINTSPPASFPTRPRYMHPVGSIAGARMPTVSIGDGTSTFGDYNGTDQTPFTAALTFLTAQGGGTLFVKAGTYIFTATVTVSTAITIIGEGKDVTIIQNNVAAAAALKFSLSAPDDENKIIVRELQFTTGTGYDYGLELTTVTAQLDSCYFNLSSILVTGGSGVQSRILADSCRFTPGGAAVGFVQSGASDVLLNSVFTRCAFVASSYSCFDIELKTLLLEQCVINCGRVAGAGSLWENVRIVGCDITCVSQVISVPASGVDILTITDCDITVSAGTNAADLIRVVGPATNMSITNNKFALTFSGTTVGTPGTVISLGGNNRSIDISNNTVVVNTGQAVDMVDFDGASSTNYNVNIVGNSFTTFHRGIRVLTTGISRAFTVVDNYFDGNGEALEQHGIYVADGDFEGLIRGNKFENLDNAASQLKRGVTVLGPTSGLPNVTITENVFTIGGPGGNEASGTSAGIYIDGTGTLKVRTIISNNVFTVYAIGHAYGIFVDGDTTSQISSITISSNQFRGSTQGAVYASGTGVTAAAIWVQDAASATVSHNKIEQVWGASGADVCAIGLSNCAGGVVQGNEIDSPFVSGSPSNFEASIYLGSSISDIRVCDNVVRHVSFSTCNYGIMLNANSSVNSVSIDSNQIDMGTSMQRGIYQTGSSGITNLSVCGNNINGMAITSTGLGISLTLGNSALLVKVVGNTIEETVFDANHTGIYVIGTSGFPAQSVIINSNLIRGDLSTVSSVRTAGTGAGIYIAYVLGYTCNNNMLDWCDTTNVDGNSIYLVTCDHGVISGNVVRPSVTINSGTVFAEIVVSGAGGPVIESNIVGSASYATAGAIVATAATDALVGASNKSS